ncbi:MAG: hypothetical protein HYY64_11885 [Candidatus Rokubacteria bacterium]|nr:hypothetical protein [Candidatus Rokubacteria bacterium]
MRAKLSARLRMDQPPKCYHRGVRGGGTMGETELNPAQQLMAQGYH